MSTGKECLSCRTVLWIMVFCGFAMNYMLRINLNLAVVAMVIPHLKSAASIECGAQNNLNQSAASPTISHHPANRFEDRFKWNEYEQSLALGSYYWLHWLSQLPGGLLARRYGTKIIFGWANLFTAIIGLLIPVATHYHLGALIFLRVIQGLVAGVIWPAMHDMTAKWIPFQERSQFVSSYLGSSIGAAVTYPLCALVISWFDWQAAFYVTSILGIVCNQLQNQPYHRFLFDRDILSFAIYTFTWYCFWHFLVFDTPTQHPRISEKEKKYIIDNLPEASKEKKVPWVAILTSGPLWVAIVAHFGGVWGFLTMMTQAPSYFNYIHGWNVNATGILSGLPHLLRMIFSYTFGILSDWLLKTKRMSLTNVRKLATFMCTILQGILTLGLSLSGCYANLAITFMMTGTAVNGAVSAGTLAILVDLSSNYASVILGFCNLIGGAAGFLSPLVVGILTNDNQTIREWRIVFIISSILLIISGITFMLFGTSEEQSWNNYKSKESEEKAHEMQTLCSDSDMQHEVNEKEQLMNTNEEKA